MLDLALGGVDRPYDGRGEPAPLRHRDPVAAGLRAARTRQGVDLPVRAHRPGAAAHRARPQLDQHGHPAALARRTTATTVTFVRNVTDIDDKIIAKSAAAGRAVVGAGLPQRARDHRRRAGAGLPAAELRAARHRARPRDDRADAAADRRRARLRGRRRRLLRRALVPGLRLAVGPADRRDAGRRRLGRRRPQARPARLRAVEGGQAGRAVVADAVGTRPAGLAPRVLGDGHEVPRRRPSTSTAAGSTSSSRTTRTSSRSRPRPATASRATGCTTAW